MGLVRFLSALFTMKKSIFRSGLFKVFLFTGLTGTAFAAHYHGDDGVYPPWLGGKNLGELKFDVSTENREARKHFLTGLKLAHTYEFPEAVWSFREAQRLDPEFAMAYWGEIMASHMFVWYAKEPEQARDALKKMDKYADLNGLNEKEKGLIDAGRLLVEGNGHELLPFQEGSLLQQFRDKLKALHEKFPDDPEIKVYYGYAILGSRRGVRDFKTNQKARRLFNEVLDENPKHPGALHYLIHASENPVQGFWAKGAAETFGKISSASIHALHMPSHYYYTQGDWQKVIEINKNAWDASRQRITDMGLSEDSLEFHGIGWVSYGLLQQAKHQEAYRTLKELYDLFEKKPTATKRKYLLFARAGFLVDCPVDAEEYNLVRKARVESGNAVISAVGANLFAEAYAAWRTSDDIALEKVAREYRSFITNDTSWMGPPDQDAIAIMHSLMEALVALSLGNEDKAEQLLHSASSQEDHMVHEHGIPLVVKPANELYADVLRSFGRPGEAIHFYKKSLSYQPGRLWALRGIQLAEEMLDKMQNK